MPKKGGGGWSGGTDCQLSGRSRGERQTFIQGALTRAFLLFLLCIKNKLSFLLIFFLYIKIYGPRYKEILKSDS